MVDVVQVYDMTTAKAYEIRDTRAQLLSHQGLDLPELETYQRFAPVQSHHVGVIAVSGHANQRVQRESMQLCPFCYDYMVEHGFVQQTKLAFLLVEPAYSKDFKGYFFFYSFIIHRYKAIDSRMSINYQSMDVGGLAKILIVKMPIYDSIATGVDNLAADTWGSRQMSEYLGSKDSSLVYNFVVSGGSASPEQLREGNYLELVEFSDFQVDPVGGDILGEIRLGYWHHDGKVDIITGGSVSGTMQDAIPSMRFTRETEQYNTRVIPKETRLYNLNITGIR